MTDECADETCFVFDRFVVTREQEVIVVGFILLNYYWFYKLCVMAVSPKARNVEKVHVE